LLTLHRYKAQRISNVNNNNNDNEQQQQQQPDNDASIGSSSSSNTNADNGGLVFVIITTTLITTAKAQTDEFNVYKFDNDGNFILGWGSRGSGPGQFYHFSRLIMMVAENRNLLLFYSSIC
jgi:hypothetical protein